MDDAVGSDKTDEKFLLSPSHHDYCLEINRIVPLAASDSTIICIPGITTRRSNHAADLDPTINFNLKIGREEQLRSQGIASANLSANQTVMFSLQPQSKRTKANRPAIGFRAVQTSLNDPFSQSMRCPPRSVRQVAIRPSVGPALITCLIQTFNLTVVR